MEFNKFILVAAYVPNSGDKLQRLKYRVDSWDKDFHSYLASLQSRGKMVLLAGDLNVARNELDIYDAKGKEKGPGYVPEERESFEKLIKSGFVDTYRLLYPEKRQYTWWNVRLKHRETNKGWRVDYFLMSNDSKEIKMVDSVILD
jgi:exodeoxyribonuclease-3